MSGRADHAVDPAERYAAAERLLPQKWGALVTSGQVRAVGIDGGPRFWFVDGNRAVVVDPESATQREAFDHDRMAHALAEASGQPMSPDQLPLGTLRLTATHAVFTLVDAEFGVDLVSHVVHRDDIRPVAMGELLSPDRRLVAYVRDHDLHVRDRASGRERRLTQDGSADLSYGTPSDSSSYDSTAALLGYVPGPVAIWSPDSRRLVSHRMDQRGVTRTHLVQASPPGGGRPRLRNVRLAMLGDEREPRATPVVLDIEAESMTVADCEALAATMSPIQTGQLWWSDDGAVVRWVSGTRGDRSVWLAEMDPETGAVHELFRETSSERIQLGPWLHAPANLRVLDSGEILSWSERSGWGHLELDGRPVTRGDWVVQDLVVVDEHARTATFTTLGRTPGRDPYVRDLCRVGLDSGVLEVLLDDGLDHEVTLTPAGGFLIDTASYLDTPAVVTLRDLDGRPLLELCRADASALYAAGWTPPERFRVLAADGATEIWGLLYSGSTEKLPVLDVTYPGPQLNAVSVRFPGSHGRMPCDDAASLAALGFAVVVIDGRGTPFRGRVFQDATRGDHWQANVDDHVAAIRQLAETRPWLDLDRVGITGGSAGGAMATRAMLLEPGFFSVGVSLSGSHDDRLYLSVWGDLFWGLADEFDYSRSANATHAEALRGHLLLIHGELDDNVLPHVHTRLVDAFMKADLDVDTLVIPNADHLLQNHTAHWTRRRWDYLTRHLLGQEPPAFRLSPIPPGS